jgi:hypothetical protein
MKQQILLSNEETLQLATLLCKKVALDLDTKDYLCLDSVGTILLALPIEVVAFTVRTQIPLSLCVKHNLDEDKVWGQLLLWISSEVEDIK